ncbi:hypothetical protein HMPREF3038_02462 [Akkermansia sp. KLE1797]|nr:hypothetical protein HMPREF3038_02462 [Akkermansia sp. KLE1797]
MCYLLLVNISKRKTYGTQNMVHNPLKGNPNLTCGRNFIF